MSLFFRPENSVAADFIPFAKDGRFHLFYLRDWRGFEGRRGIPWHQVVTADFVNFEDWGEALACGDETARDHAVFTGSVIEAEGGYHIFYTGHNDRLLPKEVILHATSTDLRTWAKDLRFQMAAPASLDPNDWRDPFVYRDEQSGRYAMLLAARGFEGPSRNRGLTARMESADLRSWNLTQPCWAPNLFITHECPDCFRIGDWWYLIYSTYSDTQQTHYRMSRSPDGPWLAPDTLDGGDSLDGRPHYAAKSAESGGRRYLFGWLATRDHESDAGNWNWGGNLVTHEIVQRPDGTLSAKCPDKVAGAFNKRLPLNARSILGEWDFDGSSATCGGHRMNAALMGSLPDEASVEATFTLAPGTRTAGLLLRSDDALDSYYMVRLEPSRGRVVFDRWPRPADQPIMVERPVSLPSGTRVKLRVIVDGTCAVCYVDDRVALSCRMYDNKGASWGAFVAEGEARIDGLAANRR